MNLRIKTLSVRVVMIAAFAVFAVVFTPHSTSATAGAGGGGSGSCKGSNFCTDFGAVWRYRTTSGDTTIPGLYGTHVTVTGCGPFGGFFEYVLVAINGSSDVRSWEIGRTTAGSNNNTYRSVYFGGATAYRPSYGDDGVTLPSTLTDGQDYSWAAVNKAFNNMPVAQRNGYTWDGNSRLGWFCYLHSVPKDYTLTPTITANQTTAEGGSSVNVTPAVATTGSTGSSGTTWQITTFEIASGSAIPVAANNPTDPCTYYNPAHKTPAAPPGLGCLVESGNTGVGAFALGSPSVYTGSSGSPFGVKSLIIGDYPAGTKVCYALSVKSRAVTTTGTTDTNWAHSTPVCIVIGKVPFVQILGNDLIGAGNITTSTATKNGNTFGSWIEYGIFALKTIVGAGSGSAYSGPQGLANASVCSESLLSFTNAADSTGCKNNGTIGNYTNASSMPNIAASFPVVASGANLTPTLGSNDLSDPTKKGLFTASGNLTLNAATIGGGRWVVLNAPSANVTITGNITYANGPYTQASDIPQLIIIAGNITIASNVTQVDAWLIASSGTISTCTFTSADPSYLSFPAFPPFPSISSQGGKKLGLTINNCNQVLTVNGPVMAQSLDLLRTAGSNPGAASGDPAEVFNLRPDAYLWTQAHAVTSGRLQTTYTTELPPRL